MSNSEEKKSEQSFDRLDELYTVTDTKGWVGLIMLLLIIITAIGWVFYGKITLTVHGTGILINEKGLRVVSVNLSGHLSSFNVETGQIIKKGDIIGEIFQDEIETKIKETQALLNEKSISNQENEVGRITLENQYKERIISLKKRLTAISSLSEKGIVVEEYLLKTQDDLVQSENQLELIKNQRQESEHALNSLKRNLKDLKEEYERDAIIRSPYSGKIIDVKESVGNLIQPGKPLLSIELTEDEGNKLKGIFYIPALDSNKIEKGMSLKIVPSFIKPQEFGSIIAEVTFVSSYPATYEAMMRVFQNDLLVKELSKGGPLIEINAELKQNPDTFSGYAWTSVNGAPVQMKSGMLSYARVNVRNISPLELIIPKIKSQLGLSE